MTTVLILLAGVAAAGVGGELFVRGAVGLAAWARVPATIVAVTVAAFATSSPELFVAISAASAGEPAVAFGDAVGSNVVNVALILGIALLVRPTTIQRESARRDLPVAIGVPFATLLLVADGSLSRFDGALLLSAFVVWLGVTVHHARRARATAVEVLGETRHGLAVAQVVGGLALLVLAGRLVVVAAKAIGEHFGLDPFVVGATLVAIGTSAPELATTLAASLKGHEEVGVGAILGSNIFNGLWIVSITALLRPFPVTVGEVALGLGAGGLATLLLVPGPSLELRRPRGAALVALYLLYLVLLLTFRPGG
ncbi:MAG: calcium/sodium antiporter [Acidimicrobiales bacterium]